MMNSSRDESIDILKFIAVMLIINSHLDSCYVKYAFLATGGSIGDALFLFCSGYTLFWKDNKSFAPFFKRRINRIYPSVFACLFFVHIAKLASVDDMTLQTFLGGEFIIAIMVYYVLLFIVQKYAIERKKIICLFILILISIAYYFFPYKQETGIKGIYGISTYFRWIPYFGIMLMGAYIGKSKNNFSINCHWYDFALFFVYLACFYGIQLIAKCNPAIAPFQIVSLPFLFLIIYSLWKCCNSVFMKKIYYNKYANVVIMVVGGLCLESYLVQLYLITPKLNFLFPINILIMYVLVLSMSYLCRCLARLFSQTFGKDDYNLKQIFSLR